MQTVPCSHPPTSVYRTSNFVFRPSAFELQTSDFGLLSCRLTFFARTGNLSLKFAQKERMPIYEYACPKCRVIFNFLSKRINPDRLPVCPKCGNKKMTKQMSRFAMSRGLKEPAAKTEAGERRAADARFR